MTKPCVLDALANIQDDGGRNRELFVFNIEYPSWAVTDEQRAYFAFWEGRIPIEIIREGCDEIDNLFNDHKTNPYDRLAGQAASLGEPIDEYFSPFGHI